MFPFYNITRSSSLPKLHLAFRTDCQNSRSYYCAYFMSVPPGRNWFVLCYSSSVSASLPAWGDGHFCGFLSAYATLLETAESTWRHVKYSLVAERSRVQKTRRDSLLRENIQPKNLIPPHGVTVILDLLAQVLWMLTIWPMGILLCHWASAPPSLCWAEARWLNESQKTNEARSENQLKPLCLI